MIVTSSPKTRSGARPSLFGWGDLPPGVPGAGALCAVGAPTDDGNVVSRGAAHGPAAIRGASLRGRVPKTPGWDAGDIDRTDSPDPEQYIERIATAVRALRANGVVPLLLGGDHSVSYAPIATIQEERDLCLVWLDAHTDFSIWSGRGCHNHKQVLRRVSALSGVRRIVHLGYRGITVGDERALGSKASVTTSARMQGQSAATLLELVPSDLPCYVSIDIDVIDPFAAPGTSAPVPGGPSPSEVKALVMALVRSREILGLDIVEVNPTLDQEARTSGIAADLIRSVAESWHCQAARTAASSSSVVGPPGRTAVARAEHRESRRTRTGAAAITGFHQ